MFAVSYPRLPSVRLARITATNPRMPSSLSLNTTIYPRLSRTTSFATDERQIIPLVKKSGDHILSYFFEEYRIVYLCGEITEELAAIVTSQLLYLEEVDPIKPIRLFIDSIGGLVNSGLWIYDTIIDLEPQVHTLCVGTACSMASMVLAAGAIGHRWALPNSRIMLHEPLGECFGRATHMKIELDGLMVAKETMRSSYARRCRKSDEFIESKLFPDTFLSAEEAVQMGVIDGVKRGVSCLHL